ncbi:unnamed protein product [Coffea canephora]|uniref:Uncharacterized protein n=1 Tax=Coffea canephora TaxID=49390 RepID=A0A068TXF1_COFCA|nr:unnamed protein product [Coffea canephora]
MFNGRKIGRRGKGRWISARNRWRGGLGKDTLEKIVFLKRLEMISFPRPPMPVISWGPSLSQTCSFTSQVALHVFCNDYMLLEFFFRDQ